MLFKLLLLKSVISARPDLIYFYLFIIIIFLALSPWTCEDLHISVS